MKRKEIEQHLVDLSHRDLMHIAADALSELINDEDVVPFDGRFFWSRYLGSREVGTRKDGEHD